MALNLTSSGAVSLGQADGILIQINTGFTGTIVVSVAGSTQYGTKSATIATITNPVAGDQYRYGGLRTQGAVSVNPSGGDISVTKINQNQV